MNAILFFKEATPMKLHLMSMLNQAFQIINNVLTNKTLNCRDVDLKKSDKYRLDQTEVKFGSFRLR